MASYSFLELDVPYFRLALQQLEAYQGLEAGIPEHERPLAQIAYAAASIALVCCAVEARANYLLIQSAAGNLPNVLGLSTEEARKRIRWTGLKKKWLLACKAVTGKQLLDPSAWPFQGLCEAIATRNDHIAHAKLNEQPYPANHSGWEEAERLGITRARKAIEAARETVRVVYDGMGKAPPLWVTKTCITELPLFVQSTTVTMDAPLEMKVTAEEAEASAEREGPERGTD